MTFNNSYTKIIPTSEDIHVRMLIKIYVVNMFSVKLILASPRFLSNKKLIVNSKTKIDR